MQIPYSFLTVHWGSSLHLARHARVAALSSGVGFGLIPGVLRGVSVGVGLAALVGVMVVVVGWTRTGRWVGQRCISSRVVKMGSGPDVEDAEETAVGDDGDENDDAALTGEGRSSGTGTNGGSITLMLLPPLAKTCRHLARQISPS